jgi:hypothetical protein
MVQGREVGEVIVMSFLEEILDCGNGEAFLV